MALPVVVQLQVNAADPKIFVSDLLRLAKIVATKLDLNDALGWINAELDGYSGEGTPDIPKYRQLIGTPKARNPYRGWEAIHFEDGEDAKLHSTVYVGQSVGSLEETLRASDKSGLVYAYPHGLKQAIQKALHTDWDITRFVDYGQLAGLLDGVRNLVLDWSLKLEKAGIVGADMTFSKSEIGEAKNVTHQFFIQNVGVLGDVKDQAQVKNEQSATLALDLAKISDFIAQSRAALPLLPEKQRKELIPVIEQIAVEVAAVKPDQGKLRGLLASVRTISEGAAGNLAASGILGLIAGLNF